MPGHGVVDFDLVHEDRAAGPADDVAGLLVNYHVGASTRRTVRGVAVRAEELGHRVETARAPRAGEECSVR